jgi:hypothetical protein
MIAAGIGRPTVAGLNETGFSDDRELDRRPDRSH